MLVLIRIIIDYFKPEARESVKYLGRAQQSHLAHAQICQYLRADTVSPLIIAMLDLALDRFDPGELVLPRNFELELMPLPYMFGPTSLPVERVQH